MRTGRLDHIVIILVGTKYGGNIGSAARAMQNMGLCQLRLAAPQCRIDREAERMARKGARILESATTFRSLRTALRGIRLVVGTTGRTGGYRRQAFTPRILAQARTQKVGIVFGPEDTGLVDDDLLLCHLLLRIPTDRRAHSINLAQAVMIVSYELFVAQLERHPSRRLKLAPFDQIEAMYTQLEDALRGIGYLHPQNARHMMIRLRQLFGRAGLESPDVAARSRGMAPSSPTQPEGRSSPVLEFSAFTLRLDMDQNCRPVVDMLRRRDCECHRCWMRSPDIS
jgi:TrmH family RNA methyltransferase